MIEWSFYAVFRAHINGAPIKSAHIEGGIRWALGLE
jgi:hypothetical protein